MSILKYIHHTLKVGDTQKHIGTDIPDSEGSLSEKVSSSAIELVNAKVAHIHIYACMIKVGVSE